MVLTAAARGTAQLEVPPPVEEVDAAITQPIEVLRDHEELDVG